MGMNKYFHLHHTSPDDIDIHEFFGGLTSLRFCLYPMSYWANDWEIGTDKWKDFWIWLPFGEITVMNYVDEEHRDSVIADIEEELVRLEEVEYCG